MRHGLALVDRLLARVVEQGPFGCWMWQGHTLSNGYAQAFTAPGRSTLVHRVVYEELIGPIPDGKQLDHLCRRRRCAHPNHTTPVTQLVNMERGRGVGVQNAAKKRCKHGHNDWYVMTKNNGRKRRVCRPCMLRIQKRRYTRGG